MSNYIQPFSQRIVAGTAASLSWQLIDGTGDHGISQGIYFQDPDGNEIEVFYELPRAQWPNPDRPFDDIIATRPLSME